MTEFQDIPRRSDVQIWYAVSPRRRASRAYDELLRTADARMYDAKRAARL
jgi:GGDEF domain-containing protein